MARLGLGVFPTEPGGGGDWESLTGKPTSTPQEIDDAVGERHAHANKNVLDQISDKQGAWRFSDRNLWDPEYAQPNGQNWGKGHPDHDILSSFPYGVRYARAASTVADWVGSIVHFIPGADQKFESAQFDFEMTDVAGMPGWAMALLPSEVEPDGLASIQHVSFINDDGNLEVWCPDSVGTPQKVKTMSPSAWSVYRIRVDRGTVEFYVDDELVHSASGLTGNLRAHITSKASFGYDLRGIRINRFAYMAANQWQYIADKPKESIEKIDLAASQARQPMGSGAVIGGELTPNPGIAKLIQAPIQGNLILNAPSGGPYLPGHTFGLVLTDDGDGPYTITPDAKYAFGADLPSMTPPEAGKTNYYLFVYTGADTDKWRLIGEVKGF